MRVSPTAQSGRPDVRVTGIGRESHELTVTFSVLPQWASPSMGARLWQNHDSSWTAAQPFASMRQWFWCVCSISDVHWSGRPALSGGTEFATRSQNNRTPHETVGSALCLESWLPRGVAIIAPAGASAPFPQSHTVRRPAGADGDASTMRDSRSVRLIAGGRPGVLIVVAGVLFLSAVAAAQRGGGGNGGGTIPSPRSKAFPSRNRHT
jgi:hypothetical protein